MSKLSIPFTISNLRQQYAAGTVSPVEVVEAIILRIAARGDDGIWIYTVPSSALRSRAESLMSTPQLQQLPLWGIPFSVKDCIDIAGLPTSAACPDFAYKAAHTNPAVNKLLDAGAMLIGKTNLDQFATGLVGLRTGYTVPHNAFSEDYIAGGSSSGAALSVAAGLVSFAIGTDTGGSGRVPAAFNNIVGLKPTRGSLSTAHTVEACKTLDCLSVFALTAEDTQIVFEVAQRQTSQNATNQTLIHYQPSQSFRFGVPSPEAREFFGNVDVETLYDSAIERLKTLGGGCKEIDYTPFLEANELLFNGPWVAERYASVGKFIEAQPDSVFPITKEIIVKAKGMTAVEVFKGLYAVEDLKNRVSALWDEIDCLVVPTAGTIYRIDEVEAEPLRLNANLGYYTNFVNLLDLCAIAIPCGFQSNGLPAGITLIAPPHCEDYLIELGRRFHRDISLRLGALGVQSWD